MMFSCLKQRTKIPTSCNANHVLSLAQMNMIQIHVAITEKDVKSPLQPSRTVSTICGDKRINWDPLKSVSVSAPYGFRI